MSDENVKKSVRSRRLLAAGALVIAGGAFALIAFGNLGNDLVYYWSPSELREAGERAHGASIRLGGLVQEGTLVRGSDGLTLDFVVTDGDVSIPVHARAVPPAMFREGIGVVLEGTLSADGSFETRRLMVKHGNEYRAPDAADERSLEELMKTMQVGGADT